MWKEAVEGKTEKQGAKLDLCNLPLGNGSSWKFAQDEWYILG